MIKTAAFFLLLLQAAYGSQRFCDSLSGLTLKLPSETFFEKSFGFPDDRGGFRSTVHNFSSRHCDALFLEVFALPCAHNLFEFAFIAAGEEFRRLCKPEEALELVEFDEMKFKIFDEIPVMEQRFFLRRPVQFFVINYYFICRNHGFRICAQGRVACEDDVKEIKKEAKKLLESVRLPVF